MTASPDLARQASPGCPVIDDSPYGIDIVLVGGPDDFHEGARHRQADRAEIKVKIQHRNGYEHFERTTEHFHTEDDCQGLIFRWTTSTKIAE